MVACGKGAKLLFKLRSFRGEGDVLILAIYGGTKEPSSPYLSPNIPVTTLSGHLLFIYLGFRN